MCAGYIKPEFELKPAAVSHAVLTAIRKKVTVSMDKLFDLRPICSASLVDLL